MSAAKKSKAKKANVETFPQYLRRVGGDYAESGSEFTAEDYRKAAVRIEDLEFALAIAESKLRKAGVK